ncbi:hypothetical protein [Methylomonas sp. UP202]|nr:hypothetical protein [Methylomonas sp. UP202]WGS86898.1 hypothetical protein QC632_03880 [Methylomonas sp. UP202]
MNSNVVGLDTAKSIFHVYSQTATDKRKRSAVPHRQTLQVMI